MKQKEEKQNMLKNKKSISELQENFKWLTNV